MGPIYLGKGSRQVSFLLLLFFCIYNFINYVYYHLLENPWVTRDGYGVRVNPWVGIGLPMAVPAAQVWVIARYGYG